MKTLLTLALLLTSLSAFSMRIPLPVCAKQNGINKVKYLSSNHFYADFCVNDRGIKNPYECVRYQNSADQDLLDKEMEAFLRKRKVEVCGE